jgi:hypothetical protein
MYHFIFNSFIFRLLISMSSHNHQRPGYDGHERNLSTRSSPSLNSESRTRQFQPYSPTRRHSNGNYYQQLQENRNQNNEGTFYETRNQSSYNYHGRGYSQTSLPQHSNNRFRTPYQENNRSNRYSSNNNRGRDRSLGRDRARTTAPEHQYNQHDRARTPARDYNQRSRTPAREQQYNQRSRTRTRTPARQQNTNNNGSSRTRSRSPINQRTRTQSQSQFHRALTASAPTLRGKMNLVSDVASLVALACDDLMDDNCPFVPNIFHHHEIIDYDNEFNEVADLVEHLLGPS